MREIFTPAPTIIFPLEYTESSFSHRHEKETGTPSDIRTNRLGYRIPERYSKEKDCDSAILFLLWILRTLCKSLELSSGLIILNRIAGTWVSVVETRSDLW